MVVSYYAEGQAHATDTDLADLSDVYVYGGALHLRWTEEYCLTLEMVADLVEFHALHALSCMNGTPGELPADYMDDVTGRIRASMAPVSVTVLQPDGTVSLGVPE